MKKYLLILAGVIVLIIVLFQIHWIVGVGVIAAMILLSIFMNRSIFWVLKANAAYSQGDLETALSLYEKAYAARFRKAQHTIHYAFILMKAGKPDAAEKVLKQLIASVKSDDDRMHAQYNLATAYWLLDKREEALELMEEVYRDYKTLTVVGNYGYFKLLNDPASALAFNEEAYEYDRNELTIIDNLAQNYYLLGRYNDAVKLYEQVIMKSPKHAESYYYYALTLEKLGRIEEALEQVMEALDKPLALVTSISKAEVEKLKQRLS